MIAPFVPCHASRMPIAWQSTRWKIRGRIDINHSRVRIGDLARWLVVSSYSSYQGHGTWPIIRNAANDGADIMAALGKTEFQDFALVHKSRRFFKQRNNKRNILLNLNITLAESKFASKVARASKQETRRAASRVARIAYRPFNRCKIWI